MEIELKYMIDDPRKVEQILSDEYILSLRDEKEEERIPMEAVYYDTKDGLLWKEHIAFRVRREGSHYMGTLKWSGSSENGLHRREELNVLVDDEMAQKKAPSIDIFEESEIFSTLQNIIGEKPLVPMMQMNFLRREVRLDTGKSISVLSIDEGEILVGAKKTPISELEIEFYSGDEGNFQTIGEKIADKFDLLPGNVSKFERGAELL